MTTALVSPPYGQDNSATTQIQRGVSSSGARLVGEACFRRLGSIRGQLNDVANPTAASNYGYPLVELLNKTSTPAQLAAIESGIVGECEKDPRVSSAAASVVAIGVTYQISIALITSEGPIDLAISVQDLSMTLLGAAQ